MVLNLNFNFNFIYKNINKKHYYLLNLLNLYYPSGFQIVSQVEHR